MVSPHGIELATYIISSSYGDLRAKVCECLLRRGSLTISHIMRFTELSRSDVINSLLVLIHQNCVQGFNIQEEGGIGEAPRVMTLYMAMFDNIIHKMRFSKFLQIVHDELGQDCLGIFEGLIQHGRLSLGQIIGRSKETRDNFDEHGVLESFNKLVNARFVERCPDPVPLLEPLPEEETPAKGRGPKSAKIGAIQTIEQRALAAAAPMESLRFLVATDTSIDVSKEENFENPSSVKVGEKRKQNVPAMDEDMLGTEIRWRVNFEEFVCRLRHKACILNVKARVSDEAAIVLSAVLDLTRNTDNRPRTESSAPLSIEAIYDEVIKKDGGLSMDLDRVRDSLVQLGCQNPTSVVDETYSIDIKNIIEHAKNQEVESVVLKRYGREAYRMFRLLSKADRFLETDKIADASFVEKKDAIKVLYQLWKDNYLQMEKVQTNASKYSLFLLWKVNKHSLWDLVLDEMYHAALNLRLRIAHEQEQGKEILQLPREKLVGDMEKRLEQLRRVWIILESSLINLDDAIMLFGYF